MKRARKRLFWSIAGAAGMAALAALWGAVFTGSGLAQVGAPQRISFQIATGSISGTYFPVGEMLAGLLSHPPGVARCELSGARHHVFRRRRSFHQGADRGLLGGERSPPCGL